MPPRRNRGAYGYPGQGSHANHGNHGGGYSGNSGHGGGGAHAAHGPVGGHGGCYGGHPGYHGSCGSGSEGHQFSRERTSSGCSGAKLVVRNTFLEMCDEDSEGDTIAPVGRPRAKTDSLHGSRTHEYSDYQTQQVAHNITSDAGSAWPPMGGLTGMPPSYMPPMAGMEPHGHPSMQPPLPSGGMSPTGGNGWPPMSGIGMPPPYMPNIEALSGAGNPPVPPPMMSPPPNPQSYPGYPYNPYPGYPAGGPYGYPTPPDSAQMPQAFGGSGKGRMANKGREKRDSREDFMPMPHQHAPQHHMKGGGKNRFNEPAAMPSNGTTVMMRNIPNRYTQHMLLTLIDDMGFKGRYDFVYLPMDFRNGVNLGYAFVNLVSHPDALQMMSTFQGFSKWFFDSAKVCEVAWAAPHQGLEEHVERYRNSPVMHPTMPDEYKPMMFRDGVRVPFPPPTKAIRAPKLRPVHDSPKAGSGQQASFSVA